MSAVKKYGSLWYTARVYLRPDIINMYNNILLNTHDVIVVFKAKNKKRLHYNVQ